MTIKHSAASDGLGPQARPMPQVVATLVGGTLTGT
jgi:hypothetical protein